jgi:hypothetical protein
VLGIIRYYVVSKFDDDHIAVTALDRAPVQARDQWLRISAALASLASIGEGHRFRASTARDTLYLYFPPPSWLERLLLLGAPRPRAHGALRADAFGASELAIVETALREVLFVEVSDQ